MRTLEWLIENGYPKEEIKKMGNSFYCRYWDENVPDDNSCANEDGDYMCKKCDCWKLTRAYCG